MNQSPRLPMLVRTALGLLAICGVWHPSLAREKVTVCAKYERSDGWSDGYKVEATIAKGSELNQATKSFDYDVLSTYVVIFWDKDEVSVIRMDFPYLGPIGQSGTDQAGRKWEIAKTT